MKIKRNYFMKRIHLYLLFLASAFGIWSCEEESNMAPLGQWDISAPVLSAPATGTTLDLNAGTSASEVTFQWNPATTTNRFQVAYKFVLVPAASQGVENPIMEIVPANSGKALSVKATAAEIDYALWAKCYPAGQSVNLKWVVVARAIEKENMASAPITIKRFSTEYKTETMFITGVATEAGENIANATPMRAQKDAAGKPTGKFDVYIRLTSGSSFHFRDKATATSKIFGGTGGNLQACGTPVAAPSASGIYRVTVDLVDNKYKLDKIDHWGLVGDNVPGGWGGDVPLAYKGNGVWEGKVDFQKPYDDAGFIFRSNGNWSGFIMKQIKGTVSPNGKSGKVIIEGEADGAGVSVEDSKIMETGMHTVTLDLRADAYSFNIVADPVDPGSNLAVIGKTSSPNSDAVTGNFAFGTYTAPDKLFLLANGIQVAELTKSGNTFTSKYLSLEKSKKYTLNSAADGSGTTYNNIGNGEISVERDQAYTLTVNFETGKLFWKYYNMKVFHWDEPGGGWDSRNEYPMTYVHPYKFEANGIALKAGFHVKLNSPWDVQFGTSGTALTGTMTNGGANFTGIVQNGNYNVSIVVNNEFTSAEYAFVKQ